MTHVNELQRIPDGEKNARGLLQRWNGKKLCDICTNLEHVVSSFETISERGFERIRHSLQES